MFLRRSALETEVPAQVTPEDAWPFELPAPEDACTLEMPALKCFQALRDAWYRSGKCLRLCELPAPEMPVP
jgi:hypothetical protein